MNMKNILSFLVSIIFLSSQMAFARSVTIDNPNATPPATTTATTPTTVQIGPDGMPIVTTATVPGETIKTLAEKSSGVNRGGQLLGLAAIGVTTYGVATSCPKPYPRCAMWVAGLAASVMVTMKMSKAKDQSNATASAVAVDGSGTTPVGGDAVAGGPAAPPLPDWQSDPNWQAGQKQLTKLREAGWKIDTKTGNITSPDGKTFNSSMVNSADSLRANGASEADIKSFQAAMDKAGKSASEKAALATDKTDSMFGDSAGGGGSKAAGVADGMNGLSPGEAGQKLGINRDPAQVAGMKKLYNGEPIGVSGDSAFGMVNRRYNLHESKGSFLPAQ